MAEELTALETGGQRGPSAPRTRTADVRTRALGAPLWRLVDFRPQVTQAERAGLEAALEASGLLDAWVRPDGSAVAADGHDVLLDPLDPSEPPGGGGLDRVLCPAVNHADVGAAAVGERTVQRLLASIGLVDKGGDGTADGVRETRGNCTWVATDGSFRVGALTGSWAKDSAQYVGEGAREQARRTRIAELRVERQVSEAEREQLAEELRVVSGRRGVLDAELARWAERIRRDGLVRRLARTPEAAGPLAEAAVRALRALPVSPPTLRATFAAQNLSGAHALDEGTPLATLVLSGLRSLTGFPDGAGAQWRREAWASAGLLRDDLSSTILTLNLRGTPPLDWMADAGEPAVLTLRSLTRHTPVVAVPTTGAVHVCENPAVLSAAADTFGPACPPMVCLQGQPSAAALTLLRGLSAQGAGLLYHGDFDWGGVRIATALRRSVPWRPWRYTAAHYRAAAARVAGAPDLAGPPAATPWDPALAVALAECGVRVEEEAVLDDLLADLGPGAR